MTQNPFDPKTPYTDAHLRSDTDNERGSIHHTLGTSSTQAAPGNHDHDDNYANISHFHTDYAPVGHEHEAGGSSVGVPSGVMHMFAGNQVPEGYLLCDGTAVSRTDFDTLFSVIGTTWGAGNGSTTFNLPDMRVRSPVGVGTNRLLGNTDGLAETSRSSRFTHSHSGSGSTTSDGSTSLSVSVSGTSGAGSSHSHSSGGSTGPGSGHSHSGSGSTSGGSSHSHSMTSTSANTPTVASGTAVTVAGSGVASHSHTAGNEASHTHGASGTAGEGSHTHSSPSVGSESSHTHSTGGSGSININHSHSVNNIGTSTSSVEPYATVNYIIKT